jgi:hypothetical protein
VNLISKRNNNFANGGESLELRQVMTDENKNY